MVHSGAIVVLVLLWWSAGCALDEAYLDPLGPRFVDDHTSEDPVSDGRLHVVSFNLLFGRDVPTAVAVLREAPLAEFDVLLMQEMNPLACESLARALGLRYVYYPAGVKEGADFGNAVFTPWPILADHKVILPHADPYIGSRRIAVAAEVAVEGMELIAYSSHTATFGVGLGARLDQAEAIARDARGFAGPAVIGADLNTADPGSEAQTIAVLAAEEFEYASTGARNTGAGGRLTLDYIFARWLEAGPSGTFEGQAGSDHQPIWTTFPL